jgi:myosin heavy subunit
MEPIHIRQSRMSIRTSHLAPLNTPFKPVPLQHTRRVWIPDITEGFLPGWIKSAESEVQQDPTAEVVVAATGEVRKMPLFSLSPMNPPQFDGVDDIADLTHLNEASVINNLKLRYVAGNIYVSVEATS